MQQMSLMCGSARAHPLAGASAVGSRRAGRPRAFQLVVRAAGSNGSAPGVQAPPANPQSGEFGGDLPARRPLPAILPLISPLAPPRAMRTNPCRLAVPPSLDECSGDAGNGGC